MKINNIKLIRRFSFALFFIALISSAFGQNITITGKVTDKSGDIPGVNVIVKGTPAGTNTNSKGDYKLLAPANSIIVFSFVGYEPQEINVSGRTVVNIELKEIATALEELVVIGYGVQKKRDLTGAISSIQAKEIMQNTPTDVAQALQGKVAGVEILASSGEPGAESRIRIRGTSTFTTDGASPLFIVDGMEVESISGINPQDIESLEVLKDAASAAIYGSKSANGVIIITTKQGKDGKPRININYMLKAAELAHRIPQMNTKESFELDDLRNFYNGKAAGSIPDSLNPVNNNDFFYQELLFRRAWSQQLDMSVAGGSQKLNYYLSAGYLNEQGVYIDTYNKRMSSRVNVDYQATDRFKIGTRISMSVGKSKPQSGNANDHLRRASYWSVIDPDDTYTAVISSRPNPLAWAYLYKNDKVVYDINAYNYLEYKITKDLTFKSTISAILTNTKIDQFSPSLLSTAFQRSSRNEARLNTGWTHEDLLTYIKKLGDHSFNFLLGFTMQDRRSENIILDVKDNLTEALPISTGFSTVDFNNTKATDSRNRMASYFGRVNYNYKGKYLLSANIRRDGSSRFGKDIRWGNFPSVSLGWRFSDESFLKLTNSYLTDGKLRASYGVTGNQAAGNFASLALYSTSYYADYVGFAPNQLGNPLLGWETTKQLNYGLDLNFYSGRVTFAVDYYDKKTLDILYSIRIPQTTGFKTLYQNVGDVANKGWEFNLNTTNIQTKNFYWKTTFNLSFNQNKVLNVPGGEIADGTVYTLRDGWTIGTMFGYKYKSIFPWDQSNAYTTDWQQLSPVFDSNERFMNQYTLNGSPYLGQVKQKLFSDKKTAFKGGDVEWEDVNRDGVIDTQDRTIIGCGQPDFFGGFNTEWNYKGFNLSAFFSFSVGGDVYNYTEWWRSSMKWAGDKPNPMIVKRAWKAPGDIASFYKPVAGGAVDNPREATSIWVEDGSYIRLKSVRIGYNLPSSITDKLKIGTVNAYVQMRDLFTWTKYSGFDPEVNSRNSVFSIGYDDNAYPRSRDMVFGINVNF